MPKPNDPPQPVPVDVDVDGASSSAPAAPVAEAEFVAKGPITIDGTRAYNKGDRVSASAVAKNSLEDQVQKA